MSKAKLALRREQRRTAALSELERLAGVEDRSHSHLRRLATLIDLANEELEGISCFVFDLFDKCEESHGLYDWATMFAFNVVYA